MKIWTNICTLITDNYVVYAFNCASHTPCVIAAYLTPNYVFCSPDGQQPITEVFAYEKGPVGGCGIGQICWFVTGSI